MSTNGATRPATRAKSRGAARSASARPAAAAPTAVPAVVSTAPTGIEHTATTCRAREMIDRVADKWSMYVIHVLARASPLRFSELRRRVDGVSQRMLTVTLRGLERDGLVRRTMYPEVPPRVEYALTPLGATLREIVHALIDWSEAHLQAVDAARARYDAQARHWATTDD
jgi:DNA-binding HxlR family transcriptional regulator